MHHDLNINIEYAVFNQFYFSTLLYWKEQCKCNRMGVGIYYHQMGKSDPKSNPHVTVRSHPEAERARASPGLVVSCTSTHAG